MSTRTIIVMLLAITFGACAAIGVGRLRNFSGASDDDLQPVVLAAADVKGGQVLDAKSLKLAHRRPQEIPKGAFTSIDEVLKRTALVALIANEPILSARVSEKDGGSGLAATLEKGMRAFSIPTPQLAGGAGGFIKPGYHVDVLLTTSGGDNAGNGGGSTTTILENIKVLAVAQKTEDEKKSSDENKKPETDETKIITNVKSVTVQVTPAQAETLALGMSRGTLHLSLRKFGDEEEGRTSAATLRDLKVHVGPPVDVSDIVRKFATTAMALTAPTTKTAPAPAPPVAPPPANVAAAPKEEPKPAPPVYMEIRTLRGLDPGSVRVEVGHRPGTQAGNP